MRGYRPGPISVVTLLIVLALVGTGAGVISAQQEALPLILQIFAQQGHSGQELAWGQQYDRLRPRAIELVVGGKTREVFTAASSVAELLQEQHIELGKHDKVLPGLTYRLEHVDQVEVIRVTKEIVVKTKPVPYREIRVPNHNEYRGVIEVVQQGQEGLQEDTVEITYENGVVTKQEVLSSRIIREKRDRIVEYGTLTLITRGGRQYEVIKAFIAEATAYTAGPESTGKAPDHPEYGVTFSGLKVEPGHIAVDPKVIPLLSEVYIEGLDAYSQRYSGKYLATDTGSAIKGYRIDIYMEDLKEALRFGRRKVKVYVLRSR